jgi:transcriptional regulator with XRE-family HTH domain
MKLAHSYPMRDNRLMPRPRLRPGRRPELAERIRAARATRGLTQHAAAAELGVSVSVLATIETGARKPQGLALLALRAWCAESLGEPFSMIRKPKEPRS